MWMSREGDSCRRKKVRSIEKVDNQCHSRPVKLTWRWKTSRLKMYFLLQIVIFHCHVSFLGEYTMVLACKIYYFSGTTQGLVSPWKSVRGLGCYQWPWPLFSWSDGCSISPAIRSLHSQKLTNRTETHLPTPVFHLRFVFCVSGREHFIEMFHIYSLW